MPEIPTETLVMTIEYGELPIECTPLANALSAKPIQVTNYISGFQQVRVSGLCPCGDKAGALAAATAAVTGTIYLGTTVTLAASPDYHYAGYDEYTVTFNCLP